MDVARDNPLNVPVDHGLEKVAWNRSVVQRDSSEQISDVFGKLVDQLSSINQNISRQVRQQQAMVTRFDELPEILRNVPTQSEQQKVLIETLIEKLDSQIEGQRGVMETFGSVPVEAMKQTEAVERMTQKLGDAVDSDIQVSANLKDFKDAVVGLDGATAGQTESLEKLNATFTSSDRYLKYIISRQNNRMMVVFAVSIGISAFAVIAMLSAVFMLTR
jgi:chromosome segregation ATPase